MNMRKVSVGMKYFHEYGAESTVEGQNLQIKVEKGFAYDT